MGDDKGKRKPRRSDSPVVDEKPLVEKAIKDIQVEINALEQDFKDPVEKQGAMKMLIRNKAIELRRMETKYEMMRDYYRDSKNREEVALRKARIAEFILGFRSLLDYYERTYFPAWLREYVFDHTLRWRIMFKMEGNRFVQIIKLRMQKRTIMEEDFFIALDAYRTKMNVEHHEGNTPEIDSEEEWKEIFSRLSIKDYPHKECLKILNAGITKEENDSTWTTHYSKNAVPAALYMKGFPFTYNEENVKKFLIEAEDESIVTQVLVLQKEMENKKIKSTGEAIVFIRSIKEALVIYSTKNGHQFDSSKLSINNPYPLW